MVNMLGFLTESLEVENSCVFGGRRLEESRCADERRKRGWGEGLAHVSCSGKQNLSESFSFGGTSRTFTGTAQNEFCGRVGQESVGSNAVEASLLWSFAHGADSKHGFPNMHLWGRKPGRRGASGPVFLDTDTLGQGAGRALLLLQHCAPQGTKSSFTGVRFCIDFPQTSEINKAVLSLSLLL